MDIISFILAVKKSKAYTDAAVAALPKGLVYKGTKATVADLPTSGNSKGDLWTVTANGHEYIWALDTATGTTSDWVDLSSDLVNKVDKSTTSSSDFKIGVDSSGELYVEEV